MRFCGSTICESDLSSVGFEKVVDNSVCSDRLQEKNRMNKIKQSDHSENLTKTRNGLTIIWNEKENSS